MLKLNASYSKKVPVEGREYSSQSYHASVEVEIPDGLDQDQLHTRIHDTFRLVRTSVEAELTNGHSQREAAPPATGEDAFPSRNVNNDNSATRNTTKATAKQIKFLSDLAVRNSRTLEDLNTLANQDYGVGDVTELTKKQASELIDKLNGGSSGRKGKRRAA